MNFKFRYCKSQIEMGDMCSVQCDHCKVYYAPLEIDFIADFKKKLKMELIEKRKKYMAAVAAIDILLEEYHKAFKVCANCSEPITGKYPQRKYCDKNCRKDYYLQKGLPLKSQRKQTEMI